MPRFVLAAIVSMIAFPMAAAELKITSPNNDCLTHAEQVDVCGEITADGTNATPVPVITVNTQKLSQVPVVGGGKWTFAKVKLDEGLNVIRVSIPGPSPQRGDWLQVNRVAKITSRKTLRVYLDWKPDTDRALLDMANAILFPPLPPSDKASIALAVRARVPRLIEDIYFRAQVPLELSGALAAGVQPIEIFPKSITGNLYGLTIPRNKQLDYGDATIDKCTVHLGSFVAMMSADRVKWMPMEKRDSIKIRIEDVSHMVAHVCAHELGHCLGLVGCNKGEPGAWMLGCGTGHNCPEFAQELRAIYGEEFHEQPEDRRYGQGFELMDDSSSVLPQVFLGRPFGYSSMPWASFNTVNAAYLRLLYQ